MDELSSTTGIVALAAGGIALVALVWAVVITVQLRRLRAAQSIVLGDRGDRDVVQHAAELQEAFRELRDHVEVVHTTIDERLADAEARLDVAIAYRGLVRFDAYNEMSGRQSSSIALLDTSGSGLVVTSIHHREQARVYAKLLRDGTSDIDLAPEEQEAVQMALDPRRA
ncbi:MAG: hypothetical protein AVDCRST_MAG85-3672 [uncultured Solirubrobacteraceae bacterium]|uniref:DUF4446 family protein n=1 Tax=uncultured Solirubrobacteraceae bacterium TaxID=1162706 RepID=A0A6J4TU54_9ACTN|nr:MAG: hypothetical protein AVDCRST_MAG85-3672 [uncultured Solirubrobacteraceae bacterium]